MMKLDGVVCDGLTGPPDRVRLECPRFGTKDFKLNHGRLSKAGVEYQLGCRLRQDEKLLVRGCFDESWAWYPVEFGVEGTSALRFTPGRVYDLKIGS
jgi:hypothetical protein